MKKIVLAIVLALTLNLFSESARAKNYNMVFWYPGEAGSTSEAEPVLSSFFEYINGKLKASFKGKYFNSVSQGIVYIKKTRPKFGITSWISLKENESTLPTYTTIAKTLPLPSGTLTDQFTIVGYAPDGEGRWTPPDNLVIYSSIPLSLAFLRSHLAPDVKGSASIQTTNTMLMTLKKISSEKSLNRAALLTPMEKYTLDNLKSEWTSSLTTLYRCRPIPTAPLVVFGDKPDIADKLVEVLVKMPNDPEGKEILETLRLKGFKLVL